MFVLRKSFLLCNLFTILSINSIAQNTNQIIPVAQNGIIDLQNWNFDNDGVIKLNGEWEFFWNTFIEDKYNASSSIDSIDFISVPGNWNEHSTANKQITGHGYASYRVHVKLKSRQELAIKYLNAATSSDVFVDGKLLFSSGHPGKTEETTIPSYRPGVIYFFPSAKEFDIVVQVASFNHKKGGLWEPIILGTKKQINEYVNIRLFFEILFVGFILIMAIYHLILFSRYTNEKPSLYFGLFSLLISNRMLVTGEYTIYMLGDFKWSLLVEADYLSFYLAILFFLYFMKSLFKEEVTKIPTLIITSVTLIFSLSVISLPPLYFSHGIVYFQIFVIFAGIYTFYVLYRAIKNKREGTMYFIYGFAILFICVVHDILKVNEFLFSASISSLGLTIFILFQAYFLSIRIRTAFETNKKLSIELQKQNNEYAFLNQRYKEQNESLIIAKEKAEESDLLKSAFLANMSHEIRTPMNGILGFTRLLKKPNLSGERQEEFIDVIQKSGTRMLNTVNDIIDISKIDSGQMEIFLDNFSLYDEISSIFAFFRQEADEKGIMLNLNYDIEDKEIILQTDNSKFNSILTNLIKNAIKFTQNGQIDISCSLINDFFQCTVRDTGIGIPENRINAIFNRFEQADYKNNKAFEGSGLGLAISKAYAEMLGGQISVISEEGKGSAFTFRTPFIITEIKSDSNQHSAGERKKFSAKDNLKILIAEDDKDSATYLSETIKNTAKEILFAYTGNEAIEICRNRPDLDIVLMDIKMPECNGYEATKHIRKFNRELIIIAQTAFALAGDKEKAIKAGCNDYIAKPIDIDELFQIINKHLNLRQSSIKI